MFYGIFYFKIYKFLLDNIFIKKKNKWESKLCFKSILKPQKFGDKTSFTGIPKVAKFEKDGHISKEKHMYVNMSKKIRKNITCIKKKSFFIMFV